MTRVKDACLTFAEFNQAYDVGTAIGRSQL